MTPTRLFLLCLVLFMPGCVASSVCVTDQASRQPDAALPAAGPADATAAEADR